MTSPRAWLAAAILSCILVNRGLAQLETIDAASITPSGTGETGGVSSVSATGSASALERPTLMRMRLEIVVKADSMRKALKKLSERREAVGQQLAQLGAEQDSVHWSAVSKAAGQDAHQQQMQMIMRQRMRAGRKPKEQPRLVVLQTTLTAQWPLKSLEPDELLVAIDELQEKIRQADLAGNKEAEKLSAEEEEVQEEQQAAMQAMVYSNDQTVRPGEPTFLFIAPLDKQQRAKLLAEAFDNAREQALGLATAAGGKLGPVLRVSGQTAGVNARAFYAYPTMMQMFNMQTGEGLDGLVNPASETFAADPARLELRVQVAVSFELKR